MPEHKKNSDLDMAVLSFTTSEHTDKNLHKEACRLMGWLQKHFSPYEAHLMIGYILIEFYASIERGLPPKDQELMKDLHIKTIQQDFNAIVKEAEEHNYPITDNRGGETNG